jgi:hypothetical protein
MAAAADVFAPEADDPGFAIPIPRALRARRTRSQHSSPEPGFAADLDCKRMAQDLVVFQLVVTHARFRNVVFHFGPEALRANDNAAASIE